MKARIFIFSLFLALSSNLFAADWKFVYVDTFDEAINTNDYGLNDNLAKRRLYLPNASTTWTRKAGSWYDKPVIREWWSQANHPFYEDQLSFHSELSAVLLNTPITPSIEGGSEISISVTTDPVVGSNSDTEWTSIMLHSNKNSRGWITETNLGFFIKSDGGIALFQNGNPKTLNTNFIPPAATYEIQLNIKPGQLRGTINGHTISATLNESIPPTTYLYLGAYFVNSGKVSTFDELSIRTAKNATKLINHFGYANVIHDVKQEDGTYKTFNHFNDEKPKLKGFTNFNYINSIDHINEGNCKNEKNLVVEIRHPLWHGNFLNGLHNNNINDPDKYDISDDNKWIDNWKYIADTIKNNNFERCIAALYHIDEPFFAAKVSYTDFRKVVEMIERDTPSIKQMVMFSWPEITPGDPYFSLQNADLTHIDYVAFDNYVSSSKFENEIPKLIGHIKQYQPTKPIILVPQTYFVSAGDGTISDEETAEINWMYYNLALSEPKVIGIYNFGLWTGATHQQVPLTLKVQELIGKAILN